MKRKISYGHNLLKCTLL